MNEQQFVLPVSLRDDATFNNFYDGANREIVSFLEQTIRGKTNEVVYLWGGIGAGKTHLLQACCHFASEFAMNSFYLPFREYQRLKPEVLQNLEHVALIAIDDISIIAGKAEWEEALLHFYNRAKENGCKIIITDHKPIAELNIHLADLRSRLGAGVVFHVQPLTDEDKIHALQLRAKSRGFELTLEVAKFLLSHCERSMPHLFAVLNQLDQASLAEKRKLTIPFVKAVLNL